MTNLATLRPVSPPELKAEAIRRPQIDDYKYKAEILKTVERAKAEGKAKNTVSSIHKRLRQLSRFSDLMNPDDVSNYIANAKLSANTKNKLALVYQWFANTHGLQYTKPYFKVERKIPMIPTTENINKIIARDRGKAYKSVSAYKEQ